MYAIKLNEQINTFDCPDCGKKSMTVWGFVSKDNAAHAVYYAALMTGHDQPSVRLTLSIGRWGVDNTDEENGRLRSLNFGPDLNECNGDVTPVTPSRPFVRPIMLDYVALDTALRSLNSNRRYQWSFCGAGRPLGDRVQRGWPREDWYDPF